MAQVPTYNPGGNVSVNGVQAPRQTAPSAEMFNSTLANSARQLGDVAIQTGIALQEQEDANAVAQAEVATREALLQKQQEIRSRRGVNAKGVSTELNTWWDEQATSITETLTDRQKQAYRNRLQGLRLSTMESVNKYEVEQGNIARKEGTNATIALAIEQANADPTDATLRESALATINSRTAELAAMDGVTAEEHAAMLLERTSQLHAGIANQLVDMNPESARKYIERYSGQMSAAARGDVMKVIESGEQLREVQDTADKIMADNLTRSEAMKWIEENATGDVESALKKEVKARYQEMDAAKRDAEEQAFDAAWTMEFDQGQKIPAALWTQLTPQQKNAIDGERYQRANRGKAPTKTQRDKFYDLQEQMVTDPNGFVALDLRTAKSQLTQDDYLKLVTAQQKIKSSTKPEQLATVNQMITSAADMAGLSTDKDNKEKRALFINKARTELEAVAAGKNKKVDQLTRDETQPVIDRLLVQGDTTTEWGDDISDRSGAYMFELDPLEVPLFEPDIPDLERKRIVDALTTRLNREPSEKEIMTFYKNWKGL